MQDEMTADQLKAKFPNASEAFLRRNLSIASDAARSRVSGYSREQRDGLTAIGRAIVNSAKNRLRQSAKGPNKWEREFADYLRADGNTVYPATVKLRIANGVWYMPDILSVVGTCVTFYEVKGFMRDDAAVKLKVAASLYPCFAWMLAWKDEGEWRQQRIIP